MGKLAKIPDLLPPNSLLHNRFLVVKRLGSGGFGQASVPLSVFRGRDLGRKKFVAIKSEIRFRNPNDGDPRRLIIEQKVLIALRGKRHIPLIFASGKSETSNPYIVMMLLGETLDDLRTKRESRRFSLSTTIRASQQLLVGLEYLHNAGFIHRDLKPCNACVGNKDPRSVYIIDFGMCRQIVIDGQRRPARRKAHFRGTYRYASARMHAKKECGPADDVISWLYSMIEMHVGVLPWAQVGDHMRIHSIKKEIPLGVLCRGMPPPFEASCEYVIALAADEPVDYDRVHTLWRSCLSSVAEYTRRFDWEESDEGIDALSTSQSARAPPQKKSTHA
ncbi:Protein kinase domain-containing protein [Aphelenchoides fujianensis]|nr:Protein kinase domain-containing protein [Aphelenchoides fujianensis]